MLAVTNIFVISISGLRRTVSTPMRVVNNGPYISSFKPVWGMCAPTVSVRSEFAFGSPKDLGV